MSKNDFDVDYSGILDTVKTIYGSDGMMSTVLDFERVLDEADLYAFKNWELGELVSGPSVKRYVVSCIFMYPEKLMPDPRGAKRLLQVGCHVKFMKTTIQMPVSVDSPDDFKAGTHYPKMIDRKVWLVHMEMPKELMNDIREGSVELADQLVDLEDLDDAYSEDLDKAQVEDEENSGAAGEDQEEQGGMGAGPDMGMDMGMGAL